MKKLFSIAATLFLSIAAMGQTPVITFEKTTHDFGKINEADGRVTTVFTFKNEGMTPLVLSNVRASCGCTTPKWTREPIEPGQTGEITVTYNPSGRPGRFQKTVTVTSNASEPTTKLYIKGEVIPKPVKPVDEYSIKMGDLSLKRKSVNFGSVYQGKSKLMEIEYTNLTEQDITVDLLLEEKYIESSVTATTLRKGETGKLQFTLKSDLAPYLGPVAAKAYVIVNGQKDLSNTYAINLSANIKEDFSTLTVEQRQQAPIVEVERTIHLGSLGMGKKLASKITLTNVGVNALSVRRIVNNDKNITLVAPKAAIKGGRKTDIKLEINTIDVANPANFSRVITLITNDPQNPIINITLHWTVE